MLEDFLDRVCDFGTNTVTGDEGNLSQVRKDPEREMMERTVYTPPYLVGNCNNEIEMTTKRSGETYSLRHLWESSRKSGDSSLQKKVKMTPL